MAAPAPRDGSDSDGAIVLESVTKRFQSAGRTVTALDGVDADVPAGAVTGLVGPDGSGKTTLLRLVAGLLKPDGGRIRVRGRRVRPGERPPPGSLGYMPQRFGLYEDLSVAENLRLYADLQGLEPRRRRERFDRLLEFTGLGPFAGRLAANLSGGMKQKLGLACTLIEPPDVLLLDEPSVGVDPISRRELWAMVQELLQEREDMTVVWSTAYLDEAERCRKVLLLNDGTLLAAGDPAAIAAEVDRRCYAVPLSGGSRRAARQRAEALAGVLDAQVRGRDLRLVLAAGAEPPDAAALGTDSDPRAVRPRFEDAFVARLREIGGGAAAGEHRMPGSAAGTSGEAAILTRDLTRRFGEFTAVDRVSFEVGRGEIFGLLGPNGAGKSTTFHMLCGLLPPSEGEARVAGYDLAHARAEARGRIGYMSQRFSLYGSLSVRQNLTFFAGAYGLSGRRRRERRDWALAEFALHGVRHMDAGLLPLGLKQRLALAAALLHEPDILFLDEPTSGVDPLMRREFWARINAMAEQGVTVLVTSHFLEEAEYCDRLAIMYRGQVIARGSPGEIKSEHDPDSAEPSLEQAFINLIEARGTAKDAR